MTFRATVLTLYPEMFPGPLGHSLAGKALEAGSWALDTVQIRDFAEDRHRSVDDTPAGGGAGMVMRADVLGRAIDHASPEGDARPRLLMSPRGEPLTQATVRAAAYAAVLADARVIAVFTESGSTAQLLAGERTETQERTAVHPTIHFLLPQCLNLRRIRF